MKWVSSCNQQSCSLFIRCLFIVLSLVPTLADVLTIPLTSALSCFSYSSCSRSYSLYKFNCFTSWCLPLATMYKCKVVSLSLVYCCHYFIIILLILLFSIIFCYYFGYYYVYFSVILLCHFALCSSWLCCVSTLAALCPSYHLYYVLLYNLCCLSKGIPKMEKKHE